MKIKLILFCFFIASIFSAGLSFARSESDPGKGLFEKKCDNCHTLEKSLKKYKTVDSWAKVVERMRKKKPNLISKLESKEIADYLFKIRGVGGGKKTIKKESPKFVYKSGMGTKESAGKFEDVVTLQSGNDGKDVNVKFQKLSVDQFISADVCAGCHKDIYNQWQGSMHSKSFLDPLWRAATKAFAEEAKSKGEIMESKACIKCHTPLGFRSGEITSPDNDFDNVPELVKEGIFCNWCHNISEVKGIGNANYDVSPGGGENAPSTMLGPFDDAVSGFHPTKFSKLHTQSEFCGLCHNVSHAANGTPIENTYDEWKNSPYNTGDPETTVYCQDCHMRQTPLVPATGKTERPDNPGFACDDGLTGRPHVPTHYIVGGNTIDGEGFGDEMHIKLARDRLKNAADLEFMESGSYRRSSVANIRIKVINSGAGHYLPTGMTEFRQMWLDVKVIDKAGRLIYSSGSVDDQGLIDPDSVMFNTVLGNSKGEPVMNITLADRVLVDHRIPPKGYVIEKFSFFVPGYVTTPLKVETVLRYRSCSQSFADSLLKDKTIPIPIVDMAKASIEIELDIRSNEQ